MMELIQPLEKINEDNALLRISHEESASWQSLAVNLKAGATLLAVG